MKYGQRAGAKAAADLISVFSFAAIRNDTMKTFREQLFAYIKEKYKVSLEYLWRRYPGYAVFRHDDNQKWFALVMDVPGNKLGLETKEIVDIVNVKIADSFLADFLVRKEGFFRGYHFSKGNWLSLLLNGTVEFDEISKWLEESYHATASAKEKQALRPAREWIIPANPKYYDVEAAFSEKNEIDWKQGRGIKTGDTVFLYVAAPVSAILYKCRVTKTDIPFRFDDGNVRMTSCMKIKLLKRYKPDQFSFDVLGEKYGIYAVRGPRGIPDSLSEALK